MHGRRIRRPGIIAATALILLGGVAAVTTTTAVAATVDTSAWYVLLNRNSGKTVEVQGASTADGAAVDQRGDCSSPRPAAG
ncbi:hypothetical protein AB0L41_47595 [Amycolatopsis mediterranei]|uniref:hypothetical protein n=1 Tax=Amycolatopsis mediterranei TaxID=33910 RepID=UPI003432DAC6